SDGGTCLFAGRDGTALVLDASGARSLRDVDELASCVLAPGGATVLCHDEHGALVELMTANGAVTSRRLADGVIAGLARYRGETITLARRGEGCALERVTGELVASLPAGSDCRRVRASDAEHPE